MIIIVLNLDIDITGYFALYLWPHAKVNGIIALCDIIKG